MPALYSPAEVAFLRRLSHRQAVDLSTHWLDSCASFTADGHHSPGAGSDDVDVPLIARWTDVRRAVCQVHELRSDTSDVQLLDQRLDGATERELAAASGLSQPTVHRRVATVLQDVVSILNRGGVVQPSIS